MKITLLFSALVSVSQAARLTLKAGSLAASVPKCGSTCLENLDCTQTSIDSFAQCIETKCDVDDTTVASAVESFMSTCHSFVSQEVDTSSLDNLKRLYVSSQMALLKRQAASAATNGTSGNGTNGTNSSTSGTTDSGATTTMPTGTYATSCSSLAEVLDGTCVVRSSDAGHTIRNSVLALCGTVALVAYII